MGERKSPAAGQKATTLGDIKRGFVFTCVTSLLYISILFLIYNGTGLGTPLSVDIAQGTTPNPKFFKPHQDELHSHVLKNSSYFKEYLHLHEEYRKEIASVQRVKYKPPSSFIEYGEPIGKFISSNSSKVKRILMWTPFFGARNYIPPTLACPGGFSCVSSSNRADLLRSDAVVIHARDIAGPSNLPTQRLPHQRWVYFIMESPLHNGLKIRAFNNFFNWTATYRQDSDIRPLYSTLSTLATPLTDVQYTKLVSKIISTKSMLAASMISNCRTPGSPRKSFLAELEKHMPLDRYGSCGNLVCPPGGECDDVMRGYKFYMSMENSLCRDYISEKAARPLYTWNSVPVVMGGSDPREYDHVLPPGSYIHIAGFPSPKHLAEYLMLLDRNPELYAKYHEWRKSYRGALFDFNTAWCKMCEKLFNMSSPVQTYTDFVGWYREDICRL